MIIKKSGRPARKPWERTITCKGRVGRKRCRCVYAVTPDDIDGHQYPDDTKPYGQRWQWRLSVRCPECGTYVEITSRDKRVIAAVSRKDAARAEERFQAESRSCAQPAASYGDYWDGRCGDPSPYRVDRVAGMRD